MAYCSPIMASNYQKDLKQAREDLADLLANREQIEIEIARQKRKVAALSELCDESELGDGVNEALQSLGLDLGGLSDACRTAMRASRKEWMTITEIQESLKELGFPLDKYKAPTASITTTVNRLADNNEVIVEKRLGGASEYKWVGQNVPNTFAERFATGRPTRETAIAALETMEKNKTEAKKARERLTLGERIAAGGDPAKEAMIAALKRKK